MPTLKAVSASILILAAVPSLSSADTKKSAAASALLALQSGSEFSNQVVVAPQDTNAVWPVQVYATPATVRPVQGSASVPTVQPNITVNATIITDLPKQVWASPI